MPTKNRTNWSNYQKPKYCDKIKAAVLKTIIIIKCCSQSSHTSLNKYEKFPKLLDDQEFKQNISNGKLLQKQTHFSLFLFLKFLLTLKSN